MAKEYLHIPLDFKQVTSRNELQRISLSDSVAEYVHLIVISQFGEFKADESFGNELWENDFENITNIQAFKDNLSRSLQLTLARHEKRLDNIRVSVVIEQVLTTVNKRRVKQRIQIMVEGSLRKTNEPFSHQEVFFMGPLSYY